MSQGTHRARIRRTSHYSVRPDSWELRAQIVQASGRLGIIQHELRRRERQVRAGQGRAGQGSSRDAGVRTRNGIESWRALHCLTCSGRSSRIDRLTPLTLRERDENFWTTGRREGPGRRTTCLQRTSESCSEASPQEEGLLCFALIRGWLRTAGAEAAEES